MSNKQRISICYFETNKIIGCEELKITLLTFFLLVDTFPIVGCFEINSIRSSILSKKKKCCFGRKFFKNGLINARGIIPEPLGDDYFFRHSSKSFLKSVHEIVSFKSASLIASSNSTS